MLLKVLSIVFFVLLSAVSAITSFAYVNNRSNKKNTENKKKLTNIFSEVLRNKENWALAIAFVLISLAIGIFCYDRTTSILSFLKVELIFIITSIIAVTDFKLGLIPNIFSLLLFSIGVVFHCIEIFVIHIGNKEYIWQILIYNVISAVIVVVVLWILSAVTRSGMGFGDIKYLGALCFSGGITLLLVSLMFSLICSLVFGLIVVALKKKKMKDTIPFGPFILLGVITCIFTGLM